MKQTILVTGGCGYIGSHTTVVLLEAGYDVIILDDLSNSDLSVLDGIQSITGRRPIYIPGDICDSAILDDIFTTHHIDAVIHFAAKKAVGESMEQPFMYYHTNITGTQTLLESMHRHSVRKIVFSSTCAVYSATNQPPYTENMLTGPESVYGLTKRICEQMIEGLVLAGMIDATVLRYFNPIGNHSSGLIGENPSQRPQNIMPVIMEVVEGKRESLMIFGDTYDTRDGTCIRDYIHVMDLAEAHVKALNPPPQAVPLPCQGGLNVINLGTGEGSTVLEIVQAVNDALDITVPYTIVAPRSGDLPAVYGDCTKARDVLGREATRTVCEAVEDMWRYRNRK